jgi:hypothetical protein
MPDLEMVQVAMAKHPSIGTPILVLRGEIGYWPVPNGWGGTIDGFNERHGVTPAEREAMLHGSVFGWEKPIAHASEHAYAKPYGE